MRHDRMMEEESLEALRRRAVEFVHNPRAKRYVIRVTGEGEVRVTIPRRGSRQEAQKFLLKKRLWVWRQLERCKKESIHRQRLQEGNRIFFRGHEVPIVLDPQGGGVRLADEWIPLGPNGNPVQEQVEEFLKTLARQELTQRTYELAFKHGLEVHRVTIRDQRSRWGSCSSRKTISLNWRLIQAPRWVVDYLILHELMHLREMNHSKRFWALVRQACPSYREAEQWLHRHRFLLRTS